MNWKLSASVALLLALSGCASSPTCPPLPADLARDLPPPGWFQAEMERIIKKGQTLPQNSQNSPDEPTK
jgi:hypothetical protein